MLYRVVVLFIAFLFSIEMHPKSRTFNCHYIIIVDQTLRNYPNANKIYQSLSDWLKGRMPNSLDQGTIVPEPHIFDESQDAISLFAFGMTGDSRMNADYGRIHSMCYNHNKNAQFIVNDITQSLIKPRSRYFRAQRHDVSGQSISCDFSYFLKEDFYRLFNGTDQLHLDIERNSGITMSHFIFPLILDFLSKEEYSNEYYLIIVSDFKTGLYSNNDAEDWNIFSQLTAGNQYIRNYFERHINSMRTPFVQVDFMDLKADDIGAKGMRLMPKSIVQKSQVYITSSLTLEQTDGNYFKINDAILSFDKDASTSIDSVEFVVAENGKTLYSNTIAKSDDLISKWFDKSRREYKISGKKQLNLKKKIFPNGVEIRYILYTMSHDGSGNNVLPVTLVAVQNIASEDIILINQNLRKNMIIFFILLAFVITVVVAWIIYRRRGKDFLQSINVKIWHVSNSRFMELKDYHVVDLDCWYMRKGENQRLINITGNVNTRKKTFARPYQLKVEFKIDDVDSNEDFSFRPEGHENNGENRKKCKWYEVPLNSDGSFEINAVAYKVDGSTPDLGNTYNILDMKVTVKARLLLNGNDVAQPKEEEQYYHFIVRPEISNTALWMAFDPGTSGACVAYGIGGNPTDQTNIKIAYNSEKDSSGQERQVSIFPSKIKIPDNSSLISNGGRVDINTLKEAREYGVKGDFYFGNLAGVYEGRNSFQSIKKLLGYNDMHPLIDEHHQEICRLPGRDLALLLVKGLCNHFESYIRNSSDVTDKERSLFIQNGSFAPSRAIVAVPNNYTIVKAQDMVDSVKRTGLFKEVHYIYEAEAVMMCYLRNKWDDITNHPAAYDDEGRFFVVFDMGGATINTTAFTISVITAENRESRYIREIELSTKARVGYNVGGDDIDYAWIRILYQIPVVVKFFLENNIDQEEHIRRHRTGILKFVQKLKLDWMERLAYDKPLTDEDIDLLWLDISSDNGLPEFGIDLKNEIDEESAEYLRKEWSYRTVMKKYVFSAVENAVIELLSTEHAHSVEIIFSGRTSLYPGIQQTVTDTVATLADKQTEFENYSIWDGFEKANTGKSIDEVVKTAVATGACWYAMFSKFIKLKHNIVTSSFGYVDMKHGKSTFIPLIQRGAKLDEHGNMTSDPDHRVLTPNLPNVRILQMLTTKYEEVMKGLSSANRADNDKVKHLVNQLAHLTNDELYGEIKGIVISVDDKNNFTYQVNVAGGHPLMGSGTINDADIKTENSDAYAFSAMPCSEDETEDSPVASDSDQYASGKSVPCKKEEPNEEIYSSPKHKKSNGKKHF